MEFRRAARVGWLLAGLLILAGCADSPYGEVSGTVTYDGRPVEDGAITFISTDGKGGTGGGTIKSGQYTATKVPLGRVKVSIIGAKVVGHKKLYADDPNSKTQPITKNYIPKKFNEETTLTHEVPPGKSDKNWDLKPD